MSLNPNFNTMDDCAKRVQLVGQIGCRAVTWADEKTDQRAGGFAGALAPGAAVLVGLA